MNISKCIQNFITHLQPNINFQESVTKRTFYTYLIWAKFLSQDEKLKITSLCFLIYSKIGFIFERDSYDYTPFHHALVMDHEKLALQMLMLADSQMFNIWYETKIPHEFHWHPLTFFIWKYSDKGFKEGSKAYFILNLLLKLSEAEVILIRNSHGLSVYEYIVRKVYMNPLASKKK